MSYTDTKVIGNGSFGVVFQAKLCDTGELVAIKKVLQDRRFKVSLFVLFFYIINIQVGIKINLGQVQFCCILPILLCPGLMRALIYWVVGTMNFVYTRYKLFRNPFN